MFEDKRPRRKRNLLIIGLILLLVVSAGVWVLASSSDNDNPVQNQSVEDALAEVEAEQITNDIREVSSSETQEFKDLGMEADIPFGWEISEPDTGEVWVTSPEFDVMTTSGEEKAGYFRVALREGVQSQDKNYFGRGFVSVPSQKLTYSDPANSQTPETYLSIFGLDTTDNFGYFFVNGNFNLDIGESLGADFGQGGGAYIISGGYSSPDLTDTMATYPVPLNYFNQTNAFKQAQSIIESLKIF